jgi:Fe-S cluster biogenesis protein NfuA/nitrite reductase/ring-hydroxylating ferredoxin subunit
MLIHDLYPVPLEERVQEALDSVRPYMESHGGNVELLGIEDGVAKLRLEGSCHGCAASASTLELAVEEALKATAPDLMGMDVEGVVEPPVGAFELPMVGGGGGAPVSGWQALDVQVAPGGMASSGALLIANVDGALLAYRNRCAGCGGALDHGDLSGGTLHCPSCARGFALPLAGRCVSEDGLQLEPVPLLREVDGGVRVALAT